MERYEEDGEVEKTAADYDDERPEPSLQERIAMAQGARQTPKKPAARPMKKPVARPAMDQGREGRDRGMRPVMDQGREGRDRGIQTYAKSAGYSSRPETFLRDRGVQSYAKGGAVSASRRADGCAQRGKTRGKMI